MGNTTGPCPRTSPVHICDVEFNSFIVKSANDAKTGNSVISDSARLNLQEGIRKISEWSCNCKWEIFFNFNIWYIQVVRYKKPKNHYEINDLKLINVQCVKNLDVTISTVFIFIRNGKMLGGKGNGILEIYIYIILPTYVYQLSQSPLTSVGTLVKTCILKIFVDSKNSLYFVRYGRL